MGKEFEHNNIKSPVNQNELRVMIDELREKIYLTEFSALPRTDDEFLAKFIRTKNYNLVSALDAIKKYYANIDRNLNTLQGARPSDCENGFSCKAMTFLRKRCEGARVLIVGVRYWNPKEHSVRQLELSNAFTLEEETNEIETQENGVIVIFDLGGLRWEHLLHLNLVEIKKILVSVQGGTPLKISSVHMVNPPALFWPVYSFALRLLKEKIRRRIHIHYNLETLQEFVPKEILPVSYGGPIPDDDADNTELYERILQQNVPYDAYWNGELPILSRRLSQIH